MNPLDRNGQISRCVVCDSKMYWAKDCPHSKNMKQQSANVIESGGQQANDKGYEECELVLAPRQLVGCIGSISYVDSLDGKQRKKVEIIENNTSFKFGDGRQVKSQKRARIPAQIED